MLLFAFQLINKCMWFTHSMYYTHEANLRDWSQSKLPREVVWLNVYPIWTDVNEYSVWMFKSRAQREHTFNMHNTGMWNIMTMHCDQNLQWSEFLPLAYILNKTTAPTKPDYFQMPLAIRPVLTDRCVCRCSPRCCAISVRSSWSPSKLLKCSTSNHNMSSSIEYSIVQ